MSRSYSAYGLTIQSAIPLPELTINTRFQPSLTIQIQNIDHLRGRNSQNGNCFLISKDVAYLHWNSVGSFLVKEGNTILVDPAPGVEEALLRLPLLGSVLSIALHQRGLLVLHASAVNLNGSAIAFLGSHGRGKSTLAAALHVHGYPLIADDIVAIDLSSPGGPRAQPGFPQLKLWPEALQHTFGESPEHTPRLHQLVEKRARRIHEPFPQEALPIQQLFVLGVGPELKMSSLGPQDSLLELVKNTHSALLDPQVLTGSEGARHFQQCVALLRSTPITLLERPAGLGLLPDTVRLIEDYCLRKKLEVVNT